MPPALTPATQHPPYTVSLSQLTPSTHSCPITTITMLNLMLALYPHQFKPTPPPPQCRTHLVPKRSLYLTAPLRHILLRANPCSSRHSGQALPTRNGPHILLRRPAPPATPRTHQLLASPVRVVLKRHSLLDLPPASLRHLQGISANPPRHITLPQGAQTSNPLLCNPLPFTPHHHIPSSLKGSKLCSPHSCHHMVYHTMLMPMYSPTPCRAPTHTPSNTCTPPPHATPQLGIPRQATIQSLTATLHTPLSTPPAPRNTLLLHNNSISLMFSTTSSILSFSITSSSIHT